MKNLSKLILASILTLSLIGCSSTTKPKLNVSTLMSEIKKQIPLSEVIDLNMEDLSDNYGIEAKDVVQFAGEITTTNTSADEIVIIEGRDSSSTDKIKKSLEDRLKSKINQASNYNPKQASILKSSKVLVKGNFVSLIVTTDIDKALSIYNDYVK